MEFFLIDVFMAIPAGQLTVNGYMKPLGVNQPAASAVAYIHRRVAQHIPQ